MELKNTQNHYTNLQLNQLIKINTFNDISEHFKDYMEASEPK